MEEFQFIDKIKQKNYKQASLIKGIGDDAAVFRERMNDLVIAKDTFVEAVHFSKKTMSLFQVGYRILAVNVSDLAAMAATPLFYLVSIVIPSHYNEDEMLNIYKGMKVFASQYDLDLIGGDTVSGSELVISVTVIGKVSEHTVRYRHTAESGDVVFVTGYLGDSAAGLHLLLNDEKAKDSDYFIRRHQMPEPRLQFAQSLKDIKDVTLNDVSDGIASEAYEIAKASNKTLVLIDENIPIHESLKQFSFEQQDQWKYFAGEDFELLGTVKKADWEKVKKCAHEVKIKVSKIGYVKELTDNFLYIEDKGKLKALNKRGYIHLK